MLAAEFGGAPAVADDAPVRSFEWESGGDCCGCGEEVGGKQTTPSDSREVTLSGARIASPEESGEGSRRVGLPVTDWEAPACARESKVAFPVEVTRFSSPGKGGETAPRALPSPNTSS